jgi:CheY-like chemotaxis protein
VSGDDRFCAAFYNFGRERQGLFEAEDGCPIITVPQNTPVYPFNGFMKHQVLIVEDVQSLLKELRRFISEAIPGVEVQSASTQEEAVRLIQKTAASGRQFDIVILDWRLPMSEGGLPEGSPGLFRQLRDSMPDTVVAHITAYALDEEFIKHILYEVMHSPLGPRSVFFSKAKGDYASELIYFMRRVLNKNFLSCFISYSHRDEEFVEKLYHRLKQEGIETWFAPDKVKPGDKLYEEIKGAVSMYDKFLLVLSEDSMRSDWVASEIRIAFNHQRQTGERKLIPVRLVDFVRIQEWELFNADVGKDIAAELREYFIPDFSHWGDEDRFEKACRSLIGALEPQSRDGIRR